MAGLFVIVAVLVALFGFVLLFGAPYLPTLTPQVDAALRLADLQPGQRLLELGCGDGKVMLAAARQGIRVTGYELNPVLFAVAWVRTRRYRRLVKVYCADFWRVNWPPAEAIFVFLLPKFMVKLDTKITSYSSGKKLTLVSFAFAIADKPPAKQEQGVFLYHYGR